MAYHALRRKAESDTAPAELIAKYEKDATYEQLAKISFKVTPPPAWLIGPRDA